MTLAYHSWLSLVVTSRSVVPPAAQGPSAAPHAGVTQGELWRLNHSVSWLLLEFISVAKWL